MTELEKKLWGDDVEFIITLVKKNKELQAKIDKAIEYIDDNSITGIDIYCAEQIKDILKS